MIEPDILVPLLLHEGDGPLFVGKPPVDRHLDCSCGRRLIEHYFPACFIGLAIRCATCSSITYTDLLLDGEVLPIRTVAFPQDGRLRLKGPLDHAPTMVMASANEIRNSQKSAPLRTYRPPNGLSRTWLSSLEDAYDGLTGGRLAADLASLRRHESHDADASYALPFVWATRTLMRYIENGHSSIPHSAYHAALVRVLSFDGIVKAWSHHARFAKIARAFGSSFFHVTGTLMTAGLLHQEGNPIGLAIGDNANEPNPDLYARRGGEERIFIEIKSPRLLQSIDAIHLDAIQDVVDRTLEKRRTRTQVNSDRRGMIMITCTSLQTPQFAEALQRAIAAWIGRRGHGRRGLAAVMTLVPVVETADGLISRPSDLAYRGDTVVNPHFSGDPVLAGSVERS